MEFDDNKLLLDFMTISDLPAVHAIERYSFPKPWSVQTFLSELVDNECAHYLVMRYGKQVVGYIGMWIILDEGHITTVAVHPGWRRKGIGSMLLKAIAKYAYRYSVRRMTLEVRVSNEGAQSLYRSLGYKSFGVRPQYYIDNKEDALIMWKELTENECEIEIGVGNRNEL